VANVVIRWGVAGPGEIAAGFAGAMRMVGDTTLDAIGNAIGAGYPDA
jgi:hypothetical protein